MSWKRKSRLMAEIMQYLVHKMPPRICNRRSFFFKKQHDLISNVNRLIADQHVFRIKNQVLLFIKCQSLVFYSTGQISQNRSSSAVMMSALYMG